MENLPGNGERSNISGIERGEPDLDRVLHGSLSGDGLLAADTAALLADERGYYIAANDAACTLTGYRRDQLTQFRAGQLSADERSRAIYTQLLSGRKLQGRKSVRCNDGSVLPCRYRGIKTHVTRLPYFLVLIWPSPARET